VKGEQRNKSVANTVYLDIRRNELNKHTKESHNRISVMSIVILAAIVGNMFGVNQIMYVNWALPQIIYITHVLG